MQRASMSRRGWLRTVLAAVGVAVAGSAPRTLGAPAELKMPDDTRLETFDFESKGIDGWTMVDGQWAVEEMANAPSGKRVLVQRATRNEFNVLVAPPGPYADVEVSMKFKANFWPGRCVGRHRVPLRSG